MGSTCSSPRGDRVAPGPAPGPPLTPTSKLLDGKPPLERGATRPKLPPLDTRGDQSPVQPFTPIPVAKPLLGAAATDADLPAHLATVGKGVSLRGLRKVRDAIRKHFGEAKYATVTTTEVCHKWVKSVTAPAGKCRLVEVPGLLDCSEGEVGRPMYFISHAWSNSIELLFRKVFDFLASADDSTRVWLDVLAVCQHESMPAHRSDIAAFADVVDACSGGTLVVMDLTRVNPSTRAWCVFEWAHTLAAHGPDGLHMQLAPLERAAVFADLDVERAECFRPADKEMIMREVRRQHGSPEAFNAKLKLQLLLEPLSYTVDLRRLQERSRDTVWEFGEVDRWLQGPGGGAPLGRGTGEVQRSRALCVVSGAGEGKSTISAELVRRLSPAGSAAPPRTPTASGLPFAASQVICAYHFLKYNDQRRLEPVRIVKTMAFQLASRLPGMCAQLLDSDVAEVAQLTDMDRAFEMLLLRPLQGHSEHVVIVMDALDEADPVPLKAVGEASGPSSPSAKPRYLTGPTYPVLCGNRALQLITKHLQRLPPSVRFFVTTRPDAASGQVVPALERTFHAQGGSTYIKPSQLVRAVAVHTPTDTPAGGPAEGPRGGAGGVMIYHTVVRDCLGEDKDDDASGSAPGTPLARSGDSGSPGDGAGVAPFGAKSRRGPLLSMLAGFAGSSVKMPNGSATGGAADLSALYRVYGKVFRLAYDSYDTRRRADVSKLLNVLMAAQEPLSQSLVQQLGLGHAVPLLPGFLVLFYVDEHHLFTLHKSLADWLLLDAFEPDRAGTNPNSRQESSKSITGAQTGGPGPGSAPTPGSALAGGLGSSSRRLFSRLGERRAQAVAFIQPRPASGAGPSGSSFFARRAQGHQSRAAIESEAQAEAAQLAEAAAAATAPSPSFSMNLAQGHLLLGRYLASTRHTSPSSYCLKYLVNHLAAAGPSASSLLDEVLCSFPFIEAVFGSGFGGNVIWALGSMAHATRLSADASRWLRAKQHDIVAGAVSSAVTSSGALAGAVTGAGAGTGGAVFAAPTVTATAMMSPIGTVLYRVAVKEASQGWRTRTVVPSYDTWPADLAVLKGHAGNVTCVLYSPDGRQLVSSSGGGFELRVWEVSSGTCTAVLLGHTAEVTCLAMSPDGQVLASGSSDMTCRLWDAATGLCTAVLQGHTGGITGVSFSPPERGKPVRLVSSSNDNTLRIWAPAPSTPRGRKASYMRPPSSSLRPDSRTFGGRGPSQILEPVSVTTSDIMGPGSTIGAGSDICSHICTAVLQGKEGGLQGVAWCSDGKRLAGAHGSAVCVWSVGTNKVTATLSGHTANVLAVAFSPTDGGRRLASCGWDKMIKIWDTRNSRCLSTLSGHSELVRAIAWSPDGRRLASASSDNTLRIWDTTPTISLTAGTTSSPAGVTIAVTCTAMLRCSEWMTAVCFSPDGHTLLSGSVSKELRLWDVTAAEAEHRAANPQVLTSASRLKINIGQTLGKFTQKSLKVLSVGDADSDAKAASAQDEARKASLTNGHTADVTFVALSPDGAIIASSSEDRTVRLFDSTTGRWLGTLEGHSACVAGVAWAPAPLTPAAPASPAGVVASFQLASVSHDLAVRVWQVDVVPGPMEPSGPTLAVKTACTATLTGHTDRIRSVAWNPAGNGHLATGAEDNHVCLWDANAQTCLATMWGHANYVTCVAYCPADQGATVTSASQDNTIRVWDTTAQKCVRILQDHDHYVNHITYTPCGLRLASASCDQTIRIWEHASGKCLAVLHGHSNFVNCVSFEARGTAARASASSNGGSVVAVADRRKPPLPLRLASASTDGTLRVWDLKTRKCAAAINGHAGPVYCVAWIVGGSGGAGEPPVSSGLVSGAADRSMRIWAEGYDFDD